MDSLDDLLSALTVVSAIGSGLVGGVLLAFSTSVMPALGRLPAPQAMAAMQSMNRAILNPVFLGAFMGTTMTCLATAVLTPFTDLGSDALRLAGALLYVAGVFGLTMGLNVPMNNRLDALDQSTPAGAAYWTEYLSRWTRANNVRILAATAAATALTLAAISS